MILQQARVQTDWVVLSIVLSGWTPAGARAALLMSGQFAGAAQRCSPVLMPVC